MTDPNLTQLIHSMSHHDSEIASVLGRVGFKEKSPGVFEVKSLDFSGFDQLTRLCPQVLRLETLVCFRLDKCYHLRELPHDLGNRLVNLEKLSMVDCRRVEELPPSIACLSRLRVLNLGGCVGLRRIPVLSGTNARVVASKNSISTPVLSLSSLGPKLWISPNFGS